MPLCLNIIIRVGQLNSGSPNQHRAWSISGVDIIKNPPIKLLSKLFNPTNPWYKR